MGYRVILLGKTGSGKSATGNSILRRTEFNTGMDCDSVTTENKASKTLEPQTKVEITVVDTIGLCDTRVPVNKTALAVQQSLSLVSPGPHAFLIIVQPGRHTEEEKGTMDMLRIMFGPKLFHHAILVFTRGDNIPNPEEFFQRNLTNKSMRKLMNECHGGYITINNNELDKTKKEVNLGKLMERVQKISNKGQTYYQEDISIFQGPLKKYAEQWTASQWDSVQIKTLIREQGEERDRIHQERIKAYEEEKEREERRRKIEERERKVRLLEADQRGYLRGAANEADLGADVIDALARGVLEFALHGLFSLLR